MKEFKAQKEFLKSVKKVDDTKDESLKIYESLIYNRFENVISSCYPKLVRSLNEKDFKTLITNYLQNTPTTPYVWKAPYEFYQYVKEKKIINKEQLQIARFELEELKLYLSQKKISPNKFSLEKRLRLSKNAKLLKLYDLDVVLYQNPVDFEVYHLELTVYQRRLLKLLNSNLPKKAIKLVNREFNLKSKESFTLAKQLLRYLYESSVIK